MHCGQSEGRQIEERQREITVDPIYSNLHTLDGIIILVQVEYIIILHVYIKEPVKNVLADFVR